MQASLDLWQAAGGEAVVESTEFLSQQLITYIGNKRSLLDFIGNGVRLVKNKLGKDKISTFDVFSGSGVVARFLRRDSSHLVANDLEAYSSIINRCYLASPSASLRRELHVHYETITRRIEREGLRAGFITDLYSPRNDTDIQPGERVFYTSRNARYLDTTRQLIDDVPVDLRHFFLAPLLAEASVHANTSGVFKGFYKNSESGVGQFGGNNKDALARITSNIVLPFPVFSSYDVDSEVHQRDSNELVRELNEVDLAYIDPPYNQHPYGSNYFMLNLLVHYQRPQDLSDVSGIPTGWNRSPYNKPQKAFKTLSELVNTIKAKFLLISFNSEGFIGQEEMVNMLNTVGKTQVLETKYNTFRGCRNLQNRDIHVKEFLFLVEKA